MSAPTATTPTFGECLLAATPWPGAPLPDDLPDGPGLVEAARATPFLTRMTLLGPQLRQAGGLPARLALPRAAVYADVVTDRVPGGERGFLCAVLGAAIDGGLFQVDELHETLLPGPAADMLGERPLAAWWAGCEPMLFVNPAAEVELAPRWSDRGMVTVAPLLLQLLARTVEPVELDPHADALVDEIRGLSGRRTLPRPRRVVRQLRLLLALFGEFGLIGWQPEGERLGQAQVTALGLLAWRAAAEAPA